MGFGQSHISTIIEDQQGFIWIGTYLGLIRFDGLQSVVFKPEKDNPNSMSSEFVYHVYEDKSRFLWIATRNGLTRIDPTRKIFTRYKHDSADPHSIPNNRIFDLQPYTDSTLLLSCDRSGLCEFNMKSGKVRRLNPPLITRQGDTIKTVWSLNVFAAHHNTIYLQTSRGLLVFDAAQNHLVEVQDTLTAFNQIKGKRNYYCSPDSTIWFTDDSGRLCKWIHGTSLTFFGDTSIWSKIKTGPSKIFDFNRQFILVSTEKEYFLFDKQTGETQPFRLRDDQEGVLRSQYLLACAETRAGIVVLGMRQGQLILIDPLLQQFKFKKFMLPDPQSRFQVSDMQDDQEYHTRYISIFHDTLYYTEDLQTGSISVHVKEKGSNVTNEWMLDQTGRLWHANGHMVIEVNRKNQMMKAYYPSQPAFDLSQMVEIEPGKILIGSFREGLFEFEPDKGIFEKFPETKGWIKTQIFSMKFDPDHQCVWIGTVRNGLIRYDIRQDTFIQYAYDSRNLNSLGGDWVRDITFDSIGFVWFVSDPIGLSRFDYNAHPDSAFIRFSSEDGLPSSHIGGLVTDKKGTLWMSSMNGIASMNPVDFSIRVYGKSDGLLQTFSTGSNVVISPSNLVMVGMHYGYYSFSPDDLITNIKPPDFIMHDVLVFEHPKQLEYDGPSIRPIELTYKENFLTFRFSVINLTESERNTVRYQMEGLEDHWNTRTGIHQASYTNIPPGDYTFRILAANNDGVWNENETRIQIFIQPPFWQRTWFYILIGAIATGMIASLYNYRLRQSIKQRTLMAEKETLKAEAEKQMAQLEMAALRAQMNPHFIFNCLNSINRFIIVNDNDTASEYLTKFSKLIRQVLDNSRGEKTLLLTEIETLKLYIEMESLRFADKFEYEMTVAPELLSDSYVIQPMLIQPYVENAIWHGLMHNKGKGKLSLTFAKKEDALMVRIEDNGVGREMAKKIKESQLIQRKSHGMKVTAERMSLLSKKLNVPVRAEVFDVYNQEHTIAGTRVELTLPIEEQPGESI